MSTSLPRPVSPLSIWVDTLSQMYAFVQDTNADLDMAYDWVCDQLEIESFIDNLEAWDSFYFTWKRAFVGDSIWNAPVPSI